MLQPSETGYLARTRGRKKLRFSPAARRPSSALPYALDLPTLSPAKRARVQEQAKRARVQEQPSRPADLSNDEMNALFHRTASVELS